MKKLLITGIFLAMGYAGFTVYQDIAQLRVLYPVQSFNKKNGHQVRFVRKQPKNWVAYSELPKHTVGAVVVSEDWAFFEHAGIDFNQLQKAVVDGLVNGKRLRGASTITQQVVKNVFLSHERSLVRKAKEVVYALMLDQMLGKERLLEIYFNVAEMGPRIFGITKAARYYFQKYPQELTAKESAFIAMTLPSPVRYSKSFRQKSLTDYASGTIDDILKKMKVAQFISGTDYQLSKVEPLSFEVQQVLNDFFMQDELL